MPEIIEGVKFKELICKNDNCRKFLGYEKIKEGMITLFCRKCETWSTWRINYGKGREIIDTIIDEIEDGREVKK